MKQQKQRQDVLRAMLQNAAFDGWNAQTLEKSLARLKISATVAETLFPNGLADIAQLFFDQIDDHMRQAMAKHITTDTRVRDKIAMGVRARLRALAPHRAVLPLILRSSSPALMAKRVWRAADIIWWEAGDTATDYNHYSKRGLLSGVIAATVLYWLNDDSAGFSKTDAFLEQRIADVLKFGGLLAKMKTRIKAA